VERVVQEALAHIPLGTSDIGQEGRTRSDAAARVEAITARIEKVRKRRGALIIKREDGDYTEADYLHAMKQTDDELAELEAAREQIVQGAQDEASAEETLRWLRTLQRWQDVVDPEQTTPAERHAVYRECFKKLVLDYGRNTVTLHWQPALARLRGRESEEIAL
jgi:protein-tyrosine-phosphatase